MEKVSWIGREWNKNGSLSESFLAQFEGNHSSFLSYWLIIQKFYLDLHQYYIHSTHASHYPYKTGNNRLFIQPWQIKTNNNHRSAMKFSTDNWTPFIWCARFSCKAGKTTAPRRWTLTSALYAPRLQGSATWQTRISLCSTTTWPTSASSSISPISVLSAR